VNATTSEAIITVRRPRGASTSRYPAFSCSSSCGGCTFGSRVTMAQNTTASTALPANMIWNDAA
jgi:hypothetical protein